MPDDNAATMPTPVSAPTGSDAGVMNPATSATPVDTTSTPASAPVSTPATDSTAGIATDADFNGEQDIRSKVAHGIAESQNVLIALSGDPSVDELAAAIGLSLYLDKLGKRATAIYSGSTPNALEFLKPEDTFEPSADTLQDFVVALNKDKADHVRCKVDGDYVKMYITPYKTRVSEEDLEFSYGDYNVDLVIALDVANGIDLDAALREHGRIMHDASIINVTTGNPGKFGEIEWSDKAASSVSEMFADLIMNLNAKEKLSPEESTAFLTGIVAATDRFSNASTTSNTMKIASKLMELGANQQLISQNITSDVENEMFGITTIKKTEKSKSGDDLAKIDIEHDGSETIPKPKKEDDTKEETTSPEKSESSTSETAPPTEPATETSALLDDLQKAAASLAQAGDETIPEPSLAPIDVSNLSEPSTLASDPNAPNSADTPSTPDTPSDSNTLASTETLAGTSDNLSASQDTFTAPTIQTGAESFNADNNSQDYSQMMENALANAGVEPATDTPQPIMSKSDNPAAAIAPQVPTNPEINGIPEINYAPEAPVLPPPPAPPIANDPTVPMPIPTDDNNATQPIPASDNNTEQPTPDTNPSPALGSQPAMQDQVYHPQATDPGAFQIPGM